MFHKHSAKASNEPYPNDMPVVAKIGFARSANESQRRVLARALNLYEAIKK